MRPAADRLAPVLGVAIAVLAGVHAMDASIVGVFYDDAHYVILGESLATGRGYRYLNLPGAPHGTHFPPGYPALLALLWRMAPSFPENIALFRMVNVLLLGAVAWLVYRSASRRLALGSGLAVTSAVLATATVPSLLLSSNVLSETLFMALLLPLLLWCDPRREINAPAPLHGDDRASPEDPHSSPVGARAALGRALLIGVAAGSITLVRSHGIVLLPALAVLQALRRRWRELGVTLGAAILTLLPWLAWVARHDRELPEPIRGQYGSYGAWLIEGLREHGLTLLGGTLHQNVVTTYAVLARSFSVAAHPALNALGVAAVLLLAAAGVADTWTRWRALPLFMAFYLALVLAWPFSPLRFLWGSWPLIVLLLACGARWLWAGPAGAARRANTVRRAAGTIASGIVLAGTLAFNARGYANAWWATATHSLGPRIQPQLQWVARATDTAAVIASSDEGAVYLYTGRRGVPVSSFTAMQYLRDPGPGRHADDLAAIIRTLSPQYVIAWSIPSQRAAAALAALPRPVLTRADTVPGGTVYRVAR